MVPTYHRGKLGKKSLNWERIKIPSSLSESFLLSEDSCRGFLWDSQLHIWIARKLSKTCPKLAVLCQNLVAPNLKTDHVIFFFSLISFHPQELQRNESGLIRDINIPEQAACHNISGHLSMSGLRATANLRLTTVCASESSATKETTSLPFLSLTQLVFAWLILASEYRNWGAEHQNRSLACWRRLWSYHLVMGYSRSNGPEHERILKQQKNVSLWKKYIQQALAFISISLKILSGIVHSESEKQCTIMQ